MAIPVLGYLGKAIGFLGLSHTIDADANGVRIYPAPVNGVDGAGVRAYTDPATPTRTDLLVDRNIVAAGGYRAIVGPFTVKGSNLTPFSINQLMLVPGTSASMMCPMPFAGCIVGVVFICSSYGGTAPSVTLKPVINGTASAYTVTGASSTNGAISSTATYGTYPYAAGSVLALNLQLGTSVTAYDCHAFMMVHI